METILLASYTSADFPYLSKWLRDEEQMHNWGMPPFKKEDILPWIKDPTRLILMIKEGVKGKVVGFVNFYEWHKERATASFGILIDPKYQNQGFGKVAVEKSNKYAFGKMGLKRIELYIEAGNERSRHIMEKSGYVLDRFDPIKQKYYYHMET